MPETQDIAPIEPRKAITVAVAERYGMEAEKFELALRNTVFLEGNAAEYAAFLVVCNEYRLNPLTKEIYAFKNKQTQKIVPVVSVDGWVTLCNSHPAFDGLSFTEHTDEKGQLEAITCTIYRKDRSRPIEITEHLSECIRDTAPWKMKHRMLRHKALQQCARYAFGFSGIYDEDDAERLTATVVADDTPLLGSGGFEAAQKAARKPRKPAPAGADNPATEPEEASHARQEAEDEAEEAEFEDGGLDERPTSPEEATATGGAPAVETEPDTSGSAAPASEASQGQPASSTAPSDTIYTLSTDEPGDDGKIPTYKDGVAFSRVKPDAKVCPPAYDNHAPFTDTERERQRSEEYHDAAASGGPGPQPSLPTSSDSPEAEAEFEEGDAPAQEEADEFTAAIAAIRAAAHLPGARQVQKTLQKTAAYAEAPLEQKKGVRLALWSRYRELFEEGVEVVQPYEDFDLMRGLLEFGAKDPAAVDIEWGRFIRHAAYKDATEANRAAMTKLKEARKAELKDG